MKIKLSEPRIQRAEIFQSTMVGAMGWDEHYVDGLFDEDYPLLNPTDEDDGDYELLDLEPPSKSSSPITDEESDVLWKLMEESTARLNWSADTGYFSIPKGEQTNLAKLSPDLQGIIDPGFEKSLWKWCLYGTSARCTPHSVNLSKPSRLFGRI